MDWMREIPKPLSQAQLSLETVEGLALLETLRWNEQEKKWTIRFRITISEVDSSSELSPSDWYVLLDESYPHGNIDIFPAKKNGIVGTYPHQCYNHEGKPQWPWRTGNICTNTQAKTIGRHGGDIEPFTLEGRLLWHCQRAIEWVRCALKKELILPGEPFELPLISPIIEPDEKIVFEEGAIEDSPWTCDQFTYGIARCFNQKSNEKKWFVESFMSQKYEELSQVNWGKHIVDCKGKGWDGAWFHLKEIPVIKPYRFPEIWGEFGQALSQQGIKLKVLFRSILKYFRDGKMHFLLIGFPIPKYFEGKNAVMHWIAIKLEPLSQGGEIPNGYRPNEKGFLENDMRTRFMHNNRVVYVQTENWHSDQIQNRGRLPDKFRISRVAIIGCGALGAPIAEILVRGGIQHLTLIDDDSTEIGNLTRHTLAIDDIDKYKSVQLMKRLNSLNPHAAVESISEKLNSRNEAVIEKLKEQDIIVDCTGNDELLHVLAAIKFSIAIHFLSISIGFRAKRMFLFHAKETVFPADEFIDKINPWLEVENNEFKGEKYPREAIGCYHPVFPASCADMWMWSGLTVKAISEIVAFESTDPILHVYEQTIKEDGSVSIHRAAEAPTYE